MTKNVLLTVSGFQAAPGTEEDEPIEIMAPASYYKRNGKHYVLYEEFRESGMEQTKNCIKFCESSLEVRKNGFVNTNMLFQPNKKSIAYYETPFGTFSMGITANEIHLTEEPEHIHLDMDYVLDVNLMPMASCTLNMDIVPSGKGN